MSTLPPPVPQGEATPPQTSAKSGKGKLVGIILGSVLGVVLIVIAILFFLPKEELPIEPAKPDTALADYLRGKRLTYVLTEDVLKAGPFAAMMGPSLTAQLSGKTVFQQFDKDSNTTQFGLAIPNMSAAGSPEPGSERMAVVEKGTYSIDGLNLVITKAGGNDTVVFTKAEPVAGDEVIMKYPSGEKVRVGIVKVEPAEPLEDFNMAMMGSLGLGAGMPAGGLANLFPATGSAGGAGKGKGKGKGKGVGYSQSSSLAGKRAEWTFGGGGKDLTRWKGQSAQNVLGVFGNPDQGKPWGQGGGAWTYKKMKITDAQGSPHKSVTFFIQNGQVVDIKLSTATAQP